MEIPILNTIFISLLLILVFKLIFKSKRRHLNLPPCPNPTLPIIGHLHLLKHPLHRTFHTLSKQYGKIFSLKFGSQLVVVVSSSAAAEECFTKNDIVLANRPKLLMSKHLGYNYTSMVGSSYGDHWRNLRRISALDIFSTSRLNVFLSIRKDEVNQLVKRLARDSVEFGGKVKMRPLLTELTFNNIMRMVAGKRYFGNDVCNEEEAKKFKDLVSEVFEVAGVSSPVDFLPILALLDNNAHEKRLISLSERIDVFLQGIIEEHRKNKGSNTMIDHLLSLQETQPEYYTDQIIKGLCMALILGGTDTAALTMEWALSNLLNNPEILTKAREEIEQVGKDRLVEESDVTKLKYLQNIISETFRLCPAGPLLLPHMSSADCKVGGYDVPADTIVMINAWAMHRDPKLWTDATSFKPERFSSGGDGEVNKIIPFGAGRRICPAAGLAQRIVGLTLATLIQCFEWERVDENLIDLTEGKGLTMPKADPLVAFCKARSVADIVLH